MDAKIENEANNSDARRGVQQTGPRTGQGKSLCFSSFFTIWVTSVRLSSRTWLVTRTRFYPMFSVSPNGCFKIVALRSLPHCIIQVIHRARFLLHRNLVVDLSVTPAGNIGSCSCGILLSYSNAIRSATLFRIIPISLADRIYGARSGVLYFQRERP
jgi:hypothetical protein